MSAIVKEFKKNQGYARMKDLKADGFQTRDIRQLLAAGKIVKVKPGVYRLSETQPAETSGLVEVCLAIPKAVICLTTALAFYDLTTFVPTTISYAILRSDKPIKLVHPPTEPYFFSNTQYRAGIEHQKLKAGAIRIYGMEKTICDCFRLRNRIGEDLALEGLKAYLQLRTRNLPTLMQFAEICRVKGIISQYVKAIIG